MATLFVDTSAFYALADRTDRHRAAALAAFQTYATDDLVTTDHVVVETWLLICSRLGVRPRWASGTLSKAS